MSEKPTHGRFRTAGRVGRRGFLGGMVGVAATMTSVRPASASETPAPASETESRARWDLRLGHATDLSGNGHDGEPGPGVSFSDAGARLDGSDGGEITVPYAVGYQPETVGLVDVGGLWRLDLEGVRLASPATDYHAIVSGRAANDGWIVYVTPTGSIEFWMRQSAGGPAYAKASSGVVAAVGESYDIAAEWDGVRLSIAVSGAAEGTGSTEIAGQYVPMANSGPVRFGNGGNNGTQFFFDGTVAGASVTITPPVISPVDAAFFGLWDSSAEAWVVDSRLDFTVASTLAPVETAVKRRDYAAAKRALHDHFRGRADKATLPFQYNGTFRPGLIPLFLDHIWTLGTGEIYQDSITVGGVDDTVTAEVTDAVVGAVEAGSDDVVFFLMARDKEASTAAFHSRSATSGNPVLEVTRADGSVTEVPAVADTYIKSGADADRVFGAEPDLQVRDEGDGPYGPETRKAYLMFPLAEVTEAPAAATLRLTGRNATSDSDKRVLVFQSRETFDETTRSWANTVQNTFSWQADPGGFDWMTPTGADREYGYQLPRFYFAGPLTDAYRETGDEAIATGLAGLLTDFVADADTYGTPYGAGSYPRSLDTAQRIINWIYALEVLRSSPSLGPDDMSAILRTIEKSGRYLATASSSSPNWMLSQKQALTAIAIHFPEFTESRAWLDNAREFLSGQLAQVLYPDGGYAEATDSYAYGVASTYAGLHAYFESNGHSLGGKQDLHRLVRFLADQNLPGGWGPGYGDGGTADRRPALERFAKLFDDAELRHIATDGEQGAAPPYTSTLYPDTRVAVLRSGWGPDAAYLRINADRGPHSHPDDLALTVYAHGRPLLPEMGAFTYSSDPRSNWLRRSTEAQTTVEIDQTAQNLNADGKFETFTTNGVFDLLRVWTDATPGVRHTRTVLFVRPDKWLVSDQLQPSDQQAHTYRQNWHFLPDARPSVDPASRATFTDFAEGANLRIVPADPDHLAAELKAGYYSPQFYTVANTTYLSYSRSDTGPTVFDTLLLPTPGATPPRGELQRLAVAGANRGEASALSLTFGPSHTAAYCVNHTGGAPRLAFGSYTFDGAFAYVERDDARGTWLLYGGSELTFEDGPLVRSPTQFDDLAVRLDPSTGMVEITGTRLVPSTDPEHAIRIAAPWARTVTLNGTSVTFTRRSGLILAAATPDDRRSVQ